MSLQGATKPISGGISSNILVDRLQMLIDSGMLTKHDDPSNKQKAIYSLTEMSIALVPVLAQLGAWGRRYLPASRELSIRAQLLEEGGPEMWEQFIDELRVLHVDKRSKSVGPSVVEQRQFAYERVLAKEKKKRNSPAGYVTLRTPECKRLPFSIPHLYVNCDGRVSINSLK